MAFRHQGELLPLPGYLADMGRWPAHKQAVIRLSCRGLPAPTSLAGLTTPSRRSTAIHSGFLAAAAAGRQVRPEDLPLLTGMSQELIDHYLALLDRYGLASIARRR